MTSTQISPGNLDELWKVAQDLKDQKSRLQEKQSEIKEQVIRELKTKFEQLIRTRKLTTTINLEIDADIDYSWEPADDVGNIDFCQTDVRHIRTEILQLLREKIDELEDHDDIVQFKLKTKVFVDKCNLWADALDIERGVFIDEIKDTCD